MRARLYCPVGELELDQTFESEAVLGRSPSCTIKLSPGLLSAQHARISWDSERGCYTLEDLGSSNGTRLDGKPVQGPLALGHLHVITLAEHYDLVFQDLDRCAARHAPPSKGADWTTRTSIEVLDVPLPGLLQANATPPHEKTLLQRLSLPLPDLLRGRRTDSRTADSSTADSRTADSRAADSRRKEPRVEPASDSVRAARWSLDVLDAESGTRRHILEAGDNLIGRSAGADIIIASSEISRRHARLTVRDGRLFVHDLGSRNQTFVDDEAIDSETELTPGRRLRFGEVEARVLVGGPADREAPVNGGGKR